MKKLTNESGFVRAGLVFLVVIVIGVFYLTRWRGVDLDVAESGKAMAGDLGQAAETVRDTAEDAFLTAKVKTALVLSKSASAFGVDVDSDGGMVTLTGAVSSNEIRAAVLEIAGDTEGVREVVDRIHVDPQVILGTEEEEVVERLAELEIESAVYERLLHSDGVDARWIRVLVDGRVVRLTGSVPDSSQKGRAADLVESVAGVETVVNELEVSHRAASVSSGRL